MKDNLLRSAKALLFVVTSVVASALCGLLLMFAVYLLPVGSIRDNVRDSSPVYDKEGLTGQYISWLTSSRMDNYTDTIMLSEAAYSGEGSALSKALLNKYIYVADPALYSESGYLIRMLDPSPDGSSTEVSYSRYWHGYLVLLKPMLEVFDIVGIRVVNAVFQIVMLALVLWELFRLDKTKKLIIPLVLAVLAINPVSTALNMQYAAIYNIMLVSMFVMMKFGLYKSDHVWRLFLFIGISAAFFDFLTYPLVCFGIPLIVLLVAADKDSSFNIRTMFKTGLAWGIGYASMWGAKWVLSDLILGTETISDALDQIVLRTVTNAYSETGIESDNVIVVIGYNMEAFRDYLSLGIVLVSIIGFIVYIAVKKKKFKLNEKYVLALLLIALFPFIWYMVLSNHSAIHFWMTYRNLTVTIMAVASLCSLCVVSRE